MKRLWLVFAQTVTVLLALYFVVLTLRPDWLQRGAGASVPPAAPVQVAPPVRTGSASAPAAAQPSSFSAAVRKAAPAVVSIDTSAVPRHRSQNDPWFQFFFGGDGSGGGTVQSGLGSGVIVRADGYVLTNNHVVEKPTKLKWCLPMAGTPRPRSSAPIPIPIWRCSKSRCPTCR
jgi:S1-C subfamily serine protease